MSQNSEENTRRGGLSVAVQHLAQNRTEAALLLTRLTTIALTALYLVPLSPLPLSSVYQKALLASAATSALRLHQRLPPFRLSREFLALLIAEDSAHYLLFAVIFAANNVLSLALLPVALFAFLHFSSQTLALIDRSGPRGVVGNALSTVVESYQRSILQTVSLAEIALMPTLVFALLSGMTSLIAPFIYYRFLALRYSSRRNPYSRQMFRELKVSLQTMVLRAFCPQLVRNAVNAAIGLVERLAPPILT
ncbi:unnamed protein product [Medioppia subpectinata]|uniref:Transmembrane protein 33 n=1 Tax=Medioppia subpectinata TaxID=1979941 RepID=A0A7R9KC98_9ACAR|nr:unnamed protein product [Medioppia subpectinata]CAG2100444.1 unnamed protein product [Medioppia subpectinata]